MAKTSAGRIVADPGRSTSSGLMDEPAARQGSMALARAPCELDTMSLFQDLKLKRRKVDSRCSSDGESVPDTSTSSPDAAGPGSPCPKGAGAAVGVVVRRSPSPAAAAASAAPTTPTAPPRDRASPDSALPLSPLRESAVKEEAAGAEGGGGGGDNSVFDGGGGGGEGGGPAEPPPPPRSRGSAMAPPSPAASWHQPSAGSPLAGGGAPGGGGSPASSGSSSSGGTATTGSSSGAEAGAGTGAGPSPAAAAAFWVSAGGAVPRINGVRPELIGGGVPFPAPHAFPGPAQPGARPGAGSSAALRAAPTVIMGESGGVRTMIWSQPAPTPDAAPHPPQHAQHPLGPPPPLQLPAHAQHGSPQHAQQLFGGASTSWGAAGAGAGAGAGPFGPSDESAAHLLLTLGQEPSLAPSPLPSPHHAQPSAQQQQQHSPAPTPHAQTHPSTHPHIQQHGLAGAGAPPRQPPLNMERLWAGDLSQLPASQQVHALNLTAGAGAPWAQRNGGAEAAGATALPGSGPHPPAGPPGLPAPLHHKALHLDQTPDHEDGDEEEQPMICMICEDKATGLHYGIITCEGCKGFFKRTVQNRRVYTCVADGNCEITKAQRNRCQYCRFKKCIEQGMVLQAVREDRMPGGRNSGAVYNLYKVKYKKKKPPKNGQAKGQAEKQKSLVSPAQGHLAPHLVNGTILKTALTNPSEVVHLRQRLDSAVSSSRDRTLPIEAALVMIQTLIDCDEFQDIATLRNLDELLDHKSDLSEKLCQIGDSIVYKLVQWTKRLPFYLELPVEVHTRLLTHKWHELLVLTTSAYQAIYGSHKPVNTSTECGESEFMQEVTYNLCTLQSCLTTMMGRSITMDQLRQDVGAMVEKITHVTLMFRRVRLRMEEYVCLKVIVMLNQARGGSSELEIIQDRYMTCLRTFVEHNFPQQPSRFHELLVRLPEVSSAATLLLESKMFYVPFLLNSAIQR